jgi:hypothetical protein
VRLAKQNKKQKNKRRHQEGACQAVSAGTPNTASEMNGMKRARDIADQSRLQLDRRKLENDGLHLEIFTLPLAAARLKARDILARSPKSGYVSIIERWRQHPDGQIEFAMRRLPAAD